MNARRCVIKLIICAVLIHPAQLGGTDDTGCDDINKISAGLKRLMAHDWSALSQRDVQSSWPINLSPAECRTGTCDALWHRGRVINDICECCELFTFATSGEQKNGDVDQRLSTIVVYHSAADRPTVVNAARTLARAVGAPPSDSDVLGTKEEDSTNWKIQYGGRVDIVLLATRVYRTANRWTLYFHLSRQHIEPE